MRATPIRLAGLLLFLALLAMPTAVSAQASITISPAAGPSGTTFVVTGTGFSPNTTYTVQVIGGADTVLLDDDQTTAAASGNFTDNIRLTDLRTGQYTIRYLDSRGAVVASGTITITGEGTGGTTPAMPRSGGGGMAHQTGLPQAPLFGLGVIAIALLVVGAVLRRRLV